jgi:hypothetical protein
MKKIIWVLLSTFLLVTACKKTTVPSFQSEGTVFKEDFALCPCCGGFFIKINSDTLRFFKLPEASGILTNTPLPYRLKLDWQRDTAGCGKTFKNLIAVTRAERL